MAPFSFRRSLRFWKLITLALASTVTLLAAEAAVRVFAIAPPVPAGDFTSDPFSVFKPRPWRVTTTRTAEFEFTARHNSLGFRDVEHPVAKPPGVFRILGVGDSFTYGIGVDVADTYLKRLEVLLNARPNAPVRVETLNLGIPRFFPELERIVLERYGMQFAPDLVVVGFLPNDVVDTRLGVDAVVADTSGHLMTRQAREVGRLATWFSLRSHLARLMLDRYVKYRISRDHPVQPEQILVADGFHEADWRKIEAEYAKMRSIAAAGNARLVVVHIPQIGPWDNAWDYPAERLSEWSARNGAHFIDVLPAMRTAAAARRTLYFSRDGHCTAEGYNVIAETIFRSLTTAGLVQ